MYDVHAFSYSIPDTLLPIVVLTSIVVVTINYKQTTGITECAYAVRQSIERVCCRSNSSSSSSDNGDMITTDREINKGSNGMGERNGMNGDDEEQQWCR